jgi:hypothetical protein
MAAMPPMKVPQMPRMWMCFGLLIINSVIPAQAGIQCSYQKSRWVLFRFAEFVF